STPRCPAMARARISPSTAAWRSTPGSTAPKRDHLPTSAAVTHAVVLIRAKRDALADLGSTLADIEGVAEAYSVTGEWDFVAILRVRNPEEVAQVVTHRFAHIEGIERTQTMVAFEVFSQHDLEALFSIGN